MISIMLKTFASSSFKHGATVALSRGSAAFAAYAPEVPNAVRGFHSSAKRQNRFREQESSTTFEQQSLIAYHIHHNNPNLLGSLSVRHPSTPFVLGWAEVECELEKPVMEDALMMNVEPSMDTDSVSVMTETEEENEEEEGMSLKGRNSRIPTKANHGKRPCCHFARRRKRSRYGNPRRQ